MPASLSYELSLLIVHCTEKLVIVDRKKVSAVMVRANLKLFLSALKMKLAEN